MPMHDWTRVEAGIYHDFHMLWIVEIRNALNRGVLPSDFYALVDQNVTGTLDIGPDVVTLQPKSKAGKPKPSGNGTAVATLAPPTARFTADLVDPKPRRRPKRIAVRHVSTHKVVALVELILPGNKSNRRDFESLVEKMTDALLQGLHLLVIDPFPPTKRDPNGVPAAVWKRLGGKPPFQLPKDKPLTLAAYQNGDDRLRAYVEPVAAGDKLPDMPLFLTPDRYVYVPLERSYRAAWESVPAIWRQPLEA
jgi:hypothetical protein